MIYFKTIDEIEKIKRNGDILGRAHAEVAKLVKPGVSTKELDNIAESFIKDNGALPSFLNYNGFPASLCISVNEVVVHGIPGDYILKEGDIISIDCGVYKEGYHADSAYSYHIGEIDEIAKKLLETTKKALYLGIEAMKQGNRIGDISYAVQTYAEQEGFTVVRELVGHGVGKKLHEKPDVPNFGKRGRGTKLENGLVIAIEPMINQGSKSIVQERDGWTIRTKDRKPSAHFEHTVAFYNGKPEVLTTFEYIENVLEKQYA
jgi:methionyl aminopeptidase